MSPSVLEEAAFDSNELSTFFRCFDTDNPAAVPSFRAVLGADCLVLTASCWLPRADCLVLTAYCFVQALADNWFQQGETSWYFREVVCGTLPAASPLPAASTVLI